MPARVQFMESEDGQHYWVLKSANGRVVATSETYTTRAMAKKGAAAMLKASWEVAAQIAKDARTKDR